MRTYEQLKEICMFKPSNRELTEEEFANKCIVESAGVGYACSYYRIINWPSHLNLIAEEVALFCDGGNLCFGFALEHGRIKVYTD